jgi:hypothetical protein
MAKKLGRLEALSRRRNDLNTAVLEALTADPVRILTDAGMEPDSWQQHARQGKRVTRRKRIRPKMQGVTMRYVYAPTVECKRRCIDSI